MGISRSNALKKNSALHVSINYARHDSPYLKRATWRHPVTGYNAVLDKLAELSQPISLQSELARLPASLRFLIYIPSFYVQSSPLDLLQSLCRTLLAHERQAQSFVL